MNADQLRILAEILEQHALVLGMQADNQARAAVGESPAYSGADFGYCANELNQLGQRAVSS